MFCFINCRQKHYCCLRKYMVNNKINVTAMKNHKFISGTNVSKKVMLVFMMIFIAGACLSQQIMKTLSTFKATEGKLLRKCSVRSWNVSELSQYSPQWSALASCLWTHGYKNAVSRSERNMNDTGTRPFHYEWYHNHRRQDTIFVDPQTKQNVRMEITTCPESEILLGQEQKEKLCWKFF